MSYEVNMLEDLVDMDDPEAVFEEVQRIVIMTSPGFNLEPLERAFSDVIALFRGRYPGYRSCNIHYHDLKHTTDCLIAMARLLHGACVSGVSLQERYILLGLLSALMHDTGYIQTTSETGGTGAQYTLIHIDRSIAFMEEYLSGNGYSELDRTICGKSLRCTGLDTEIDAISFISEENEQIGKALGAADLLGQMADRTYLERLPFLYSEFREGRVPGFEDELDLLRQTPDFWEFTKDRFIGSLGASDRFMVFHFRTRWGTDRDFYREAIEANIRYLRHVLARHENDYRAFLRRGGYMKILRDAKSRPGPDETP